MFFHYYVFRHDLKCFNSMLAIVKCMNRSVMCSIMSNICVIIQCQFSLNNAAILNPVLLLPMLTVHNFHQSSQFMEWGFLSFFICISYFLKRCTSVYSEEYTNFIKLYFSLPSIPLCCHLPVSRRSLVDWCGSLGSCKPQI